MASLFLRSRPKASRHRPVAASRSRDGPLGRLGRHARRSYLAVADPRVDVRVQHVDHEVEEGHREGVQDGHRHQHAVVVLADRRDVVAADARDREDRLDDERAGDQERERRAEDGHDRDERVADHVPGHDVAVGDALALGGPDVVLAGHLEHRGSRVSRDDRDREAGQGDRREDPACPGPSSPWWAGRAGSPRRRGSAGSPARSSASRSR